MLAKLLGLCSAFMLSFAMSTPSKCILMAQSQEQDRCVLKRGYQTREDNYEYYTFETINRTLYVGVVNQEIFNSDDLYLFESDNTYYVDLKVEDSVIIDTNIWNVGSEIYFLISSGIDDSDYNSSEYISDVFVCVSNGYYVGSLTGIELTITEFVPDVVWNLHFDLTDYINSWGLVIEDQAINISLSSIFQSNSEDVGDFSEYYSILVTTENAYDKISSALSSGLTQEDVDNAYSQGVSYGYDTGYDVGYDDGYENGFEVGTYTPNSSDLINALKNETGPLFDAFKNYTYNEYLAVDGNLERFYSNVMASDWVKDSQWAQTYILSIRQSGLDRGEAAGYTNGVAAGYQQALENEELAEPVGNFFSRIFSSLSSILNTRILGPLTLGSFLTIPLVIGVIVFIIKLAG